MPRTIERIFLDGPAGRLEALLEEPEDAAPTQAALVCHPHPQHGGTMHNKVVFRLAKGLRSSGCVVLRFNYRGVNLSEGVYAHGEGELADARTALAYLRDRYPDLPVTLAGFSFGSRIVLRLACEITDTRRVLAVGFPTIYKDRSFLPACLIPRIFVQSTHDEFGPVDELREVVDPLPEPKELILVEARDHFFAGGLDQLESVVAQIAAN